MKNIFRKIQWILPVSLIWLFGCTKKLDLSPDSQLADNNFWQTPSDLSQACNYLYNFLNGLNSGDPSGQPTPLQDNYSDKTFGDGSVGVGDGSGMDRIGG